MYRWTKLLAAAPMLGGLLLGGLPARAEDSGAVQKDKKHQEEIEQRMHEHSAEAAGGDKQSAKEKAKHATDQGADAARVGGAKTAEGWHKGVDATKKGTNNAAKKVEKATN